MQKSTSNKAQKTSTKKSEAKNSGNGMTKIPYFLPKYGKTYHAYSLQEAVDLAEKDNE